jgi:hypothetical protein
LWFKGAGEADLSADDTAAIGGPHGAGASEGDSDVRSNGFAARIYFALKILLLI